MALQNLERFVHSRRAAQPRAEDVENPGFAPQNGVPSMYKVWGPKKTV